MYQKKVKPKKTHSPMMHIKGLRSEGSKKSMPMMKKSTSFAKAMMK